MTPWSPFTSKPAGVLDNLLLMIKRDRRQELKLHRGQAIGVAQEMEYPDKYDPCLFMANCLWNIHSSMPVPQVGDPE